MDLIVSHTNADFDALGSLIAAKKLYPNSRLLLPGSQERAVREFMSLFKDSTKVETESECDLEGINRLIITDTRHRSRIGIAAKLLDAKKRPTVIIYDHHPRTEYDIKADKDIYEPLGATITMFVEEIRKRRIRLTPLEATILILGIYEETGSLTFRTTTKRDVDAVSFLLSKGARLNMVSSYLERELSEEALGFLVKLISATEIYNINGLKVAIVATEAAGYVGELGTLIHKLIDVENLKILFCFIKTDSKISIIARSHIPELDVNKIMKGFGGGGHAAAASAKVTNIKMSTLKDRVIKKLKKAIKVRIYAEDIMSHPKSVSVDTSIKKAEAYLLKNRLDAAPVVSKDKLVGIVTLGNIRKAIKRKYEHSRVKGYMSTKFDTVTPKTPIHAVHKLISKRHAGYLPVIKGKKLTGLITGSDMVKVLHRGLFIKEPRKHEILNLKKKMIAMLPPKIMRTLRLIGRLATEEDFNAFAVGGFVRDILSSVKNYDIDIVVEGDAIKFARVLRQKVNGALVIHHKFGTATVVMPWGIGETPRFKVDIATARRETYKFPAALPDVEFSSLKEDLYRRDFTINAMAVALNKKCFGQLIDFFKGQEDLISKRIKVLHDKSFIDDPTRIFRAVRFEKRFNFRITKYTQRLIKTAIRQDMFGRTEKQRIRDELVLMLKEKDPIKAVKRMHQLHELRFIHPGIKLTAEMVRLFQSIKHVSDWYNTTHIKTRGLDVWLMYLMALLDGLKFSSAKTLCEKFVFRKKDTQRILSVKESGPKALKYLSTNTAPKPSQLYKMLHFLSYEAILFLAAKTKKKKELARVKEFLLKFNDVKIEVRGNHLKKMGLHPGPRFRKVLTSVLYAKIDGRVKSGKDEMRLAEKLIKT